MRILEGELARNFEALKKKGDPAPYYMSYEVFDADNEVVSASRGALTNRSQGRNRLLDISVRVGSPKLDNYRRIRGDQGRVTAGMTMPIEDGVDAIKRRVWLETDRAYRAAAQRLIQIRTNQQVKLASEDDSDDFSSETAQTYTERLAPSRFDAGDWSSRMRKLSAEFNRYPGILNSSVSIAIRRETKTFVNTEGSRIEQGRAAAQVFITAQSKAPDGMDLMLGESVEAEDSSRLPNDDALRKLIRKTAGDLTGLMNAPVVDPYVGPAILSGYAAGVFFHEIFGHRVEGHRQKDESEGQTFTKSVNQPVLPDFLSVIFDPTRSDYKGTYLNGHYDYDDEGVKARSVTLVDHGVLKTFLLSRSPIKGFPNSNGHGRRQAGSEVVSRQSNLIVESARSVPESKLRDLLREELKKQNKPWGLYFDKVTGGYTTTGRRGLQAFTVMPLVVYRIYADNRPDEMVRGVDIVGTPLASFAKIIATSDKASVFNGICGAESGAVPVSAVAPAMLISEIEIQRKERNLDRPPLLERPREGAK